MRKEEVDRLRVELIEHINDVFDKLADEAERNTRNHRQADPVQYEQTLSIINTAALKGRKPIAVLISGEKILCPTWKGVFKTILERANGIPEKHYILMNLRNQYLGHKRTILSDNSNGMRSPLEIDQALYIETHYDTQSLMALLIRILKDLDYDYREIKVQVRP